MLVKFIYMILLSSFIFSDSYNMQLLSYMPFEQDCSDITGFYQDGREFAVIGLQNSTAFVDITDPYNPFETGRIDGSNSIWRDLKYWNRHVYIGTEAEDGIKIVSVDNLNQPVLVNTITDMLTSHNIHVDLDGYLYVVGADIYDVWIYSLDDPVNPVLVGTWNTEYCHDIEVYNNKLYCAGIYTGNFHIVDVSDKTNPITLASHFTGINGISTHDVAVTEDEQYLFTGDENLSGHIKVWDISDYNNINLVDEYYTPEYETHTSHNLYVRPGTDYMIISYYADGTRVVDISDPTNLEEIAYYDMSDIEGLYVSNWGTYAYLPSGHIISSDIEQGLFVLELGGVSIMHDDIQDVNIESQGPYVSFTANVETFDGYIEDVILYYSLDSINWSETPMYMIDNSSSYQSIMSFDQAGVIIYYVIVADNNLGQESQYPQGSGNYLSFNYGDLIDITTQDFENDHNWYVESDATAGLWESGIPNGTSEQGGLDNLDFVVQTNEDHTEDGEICFITGNESVDISSTGADDVDGGSTTLYSDIYNLSDYNDVLLTYWRWYTNNLGNNSGNDIWNVQVSSDSGINWVNLENTTESLNQWHEKRFVLSQYIDLTSEVQFRFTASDIFNDGDNGSGGSLVEAALDDFKLEIIGYEFMQGDLNLDSSLDILDVVLLVNIIFEEFEPSENQLDAADLNEDFIIDVIDIVTLVNLILESI